MTRKNWKAYPALVVFSVAAATALILSHCSSSNGGPALGTVTVTGATALTAGPCITYSASLKDTAGNAFNLTADIVITLSNTGSGAFYETLKDCTENKPTTTTTAKSGTSTKSIFFKDYTPEAATLTAKVTGVPDATLAVTVSHQAFTPTNGFSGIVTAIAEDAQGRLAVGGGFSLYGATAAPYLARVNADGTFDSTFNVGTGPTSNFSDMSMMTDGSGKIYAVGYITGYNGTATHNLLRLNADGTLDTAFNTATGAGLDSNGLRVRPLTDGSGKIYVAGYFGNYNGTAAAGFARINSDGTLDTTLAQGAGFTYARDEHGGPPLGADVVQLGDGSGKFYALGNFQHYNTTPIVNYARLGATGTLDTLSTGTGFTPTTQYLTTGAMALDGSGKVYIGGTFTLFNGTTLGNIVRLNADGSLDTYGRNRAPVGFNSYVNFIAPATDGSGKVYVGGAFTTYEGNAAPYLARLNADGTLDSTFNTGTGPNGTVIRIVVSNDGSGRIYVAGGFTQFNGTSAPYLARITRDGALE